MENRAVLLIETDDERGLVYKVSSVLYEAGVNIDQNGEFVEKSVKRFFMRSEISGNFDEKELLLKIKEKLPEKAIVKLVAPKKKRIVLMVTKEPHCLGDLLIRHEFDELNATIEAVIGNYDILKGLADKFNIPFRFIDHNGLSRDEHEAKISAVIDDYNPDYIVLAKYMRILNPSFVKKYENKIINIHHSFLPAFVGAKPYKQAYDRGVKIIGATAHFVNDDLDEGPIIAQDVISVDHSDSAENMARLGKDVEKIVLARALKLVFEDRVFVNRNKTVVFE